jgi:hypothetical protein
MGDIDADGDLDVAGPFQRGSTRGAAVLLNHGNGRFDDQQLFSVSEAGCGVRGGLGDVDGDGQLDLFSRTYLDQWGTQANVVLYNLLGESCAYDLNGDGVVDASDIVQLVRAFGPCDGCPEDLNDDGMVNPHDLRLLLDHLGPCE